MFLLFQKALPAVLEASLSHVFFLRYVISYILRINALATCSSPNGCTSLADYLMCNVFDLYCGARTLFEKPAYIIVIS